MAFSLPTFNLTINLWRQSHSPPGPPPDLVITGNLAIGRRVSFFTDLAFDPSTYIFENFGVHQLLCPQGTDIRGVNSNSGNDWLEIPAGSGVYYAVRYVQYVALGFANQHLLAWVSQTTPWVDPLP